MAEVVVVVVVHADYGSNSFCFLRVGRVGRVGDGSRFKMAFSIHYIPFS
jgi:hypothetical protein